MTRFDATTLEHLRGALAGRTPREITDPDRRPAAVLFPLFLLDGEVHVVLTKKSDGLTSHAGQVSLPGGGLDAGEDHLTAALREAREEANIERVEVIGRLDDIPTYGSNYLVRPFVGVLPDVEGLKPDGEEVERIIMPPLSLFADDANRREDLWRGVTLGFYDYDGVTVWGLTERLLAALLSVIST